MVQSSTDQSKKIDSEKLNFEVETENKHAETQAINWLLDDNKLMITKMMTKSPRE